MSPEAKAKLAEGARRMNGDHIRRDWASIRSTVWLEYVRYATGWSWDDLKRELRKHRSRSALVDKWRTGEVSAYRVSAKKLFDAAPRSLALFDLPMWNLLDNAVKSENEIKRLVRGTSNRDPLPDEFDTEISIVTAYRSTDYPSHTPIDKLVAAGDIRALNSLVVRTREAEAARDDRDHAESVRGLYLIFPDIAKLPYFQSSIAALGQVLRDLHCRVPWSKATIGVDWPAIKAAIDQDESEDDRWRRVEDWLRPYTSESCCPVQQKYFDPITSRESACILISPTNQHE